eukprot:scaffold1276_cov162-Amphora_coffeaeformis.AAC.4
MSSASQNSQKESKTRDDNSVDNSPRTRAAGTAEAAAAAAILQQWQQGTPHSLDASICQFQRAETQEVNEDNEKETRTTPQRFANYKDFVRASQRLLLANPAVRLHPVQSSSHDTSDDDILPTEDHDDDHHLKQQQQGNKKRRLFARPRSIPMATATIWMITFMNISTSTSLSTPWHLPCNTNSKSWPWMDIFGNEGVTKIHPGMHRPSNDNDGTMSSTCP